MAADPIAGRATLAQDENWAHGARDRAEYAEWANHGAAWPA